MLHFVGFYTPEKPSAEPPSPEQMDRMRNLVQQAMQEGWLIQTGPLLRSPNSARLRLSNGDFTVTDHVAGERHEVGFAVMRANSKEEIVEKTRLFLSTAGGGEVELFETMGPSPDRKP